MARYNDFVYAFKVKENVVVPVDYKGLNEKHYICVYREPVVELRDSSPEAVIRRILCVSVGPVFYKRGLDPLKAPDIIWVQGVGYMLIPDPAYSGTFFHDGPRTCMRIDKRYVQTITIDPEKILTCRA